MRAFFLLFLTALTISINSCYSKAGSENTSGKATRAATSIDSATYNARVDEANDITRIDSAFIKPSQSDTANALIISGAKAITIVPDSMHMEHEKQDDSDGFYSMADDFSYYISQAADTLKQAAIPMVNYTHEKRYIVFRNPNSLICTFDGNRMPEAWGIILFNGKDAPVLWNGTDISGASKLVFKK